MSEIKIMSSKGVKFGVTEFKPSIVKFKKECFRDKFRDVLENHPSGDIDVLTEALLDCFEEVIL